jgi:2-polyprenyl-6-methoxyphenol hydroxylase-like FAD-dependent oxidoreductase
VVDVGQDEGRAWADVEVRESGEKLRFEADYVVGCDGGRSVVRHALFGREWPGITHDCHLLVQNVCQFLRSVNILLTACRSGTMASRNMAGMGETIWWVKRTGD